MVAAVSPLYDVTDGEPPYSIEDVMRRFGVCRKTVENWIGEGLAAVKPRGGSRIFITREAVNSFFQPVVKAQSTRHGRAVPKSEMDRRLARQAEAAALLK